MGQFQQKSALLVHVVRQNSHRAPQTCRGTWWGQFPERQPLPSSCGQEAWVFGEYLGISATMTLAAYHQHGLSYVSHLP